ncbi:hypothetical protein ACFLSJ_01060 [Verrucomicrobiota bacterium]
MLQAEAIILGFVGPLGSGSTFIAGGLDEELGERAHYYKLSAPLRGIAKEHGIEDPTTEDLQNVGNDLRRTEGLSVLAEKCCDAIDEDIKAGQLMWDTDHIILIDGIRNDGELRYFRQFPNFYLISVFAHVDTRRNRLVGEGKRFADAESFAKADARDRNEELPYGQQVTACNYTADIILDNDRTFTGVRKEQDRRSFCTNVVNEYISLIWASVLPDVAVDRRPTILETLMTAAYAVSKNSTCMKRQVGAVVALIPLQRDPEERKASHQFQILASGHNEVPDGSTPCVYSKNEKCYRDYLQDQHAAQWKNCPNCGAAIEKEMPCPGCKEKVPTFSRACPTDECTHMPLFDYACPSCKEHVFIKFLTGGKRTPTRMLDMCKAVHAEEQALLVLSTGGLSGQEGELVLFTTTFPCNLCANKIVAKRIRKIVFAEPYPMEEARQILADGGVETVQFSGIKSRAYFRLFT